MGLPSNTGQSPLQHAALTIMRDGVLPLLIYLLLRGRGVSEVGALSASALLPAFSIIYGWARQRRLDSLGLLVLVGILLSIATALIIHSPRVLLLKGPLEMALFGLASLGSLAVDRPLMFYIARFLLERDEDAGSPLPRTGLAAGAPSLAGTWDQPETRRSFHWITLVWSLAMILQASVRTAIVFHAGIAEAVAVTPLIRSGFMFVLLAWSYAYLRVRMPARPQPSSP